MNACVLPHKPNGHVSCLSDRTQRMYSLSHIEGNALCYLSKRTLRMRTVENRMKRVYAVSRTQRKLRQPSLKPNGMYLFYLFVCFRLPSSSPSGRVRKISPPTGFRSVEYLLGITGNMPGLVCRI